MTLRHEDRQPGLFPAGAAAVSAAGEDAGLSLTVDERGIARITFGAPGAKLNTLTTTAMEALDSLLAEVRAKGEVRALIFRSARPGMFIAGADVAEIEAISDGAEGEGKSRRGQQIFQRIADLAVPTAAVIGGPCLGAGLELALACDFRVVSDSPEVRIGLTEVRLGVLPGFGGTQRLPALVGLAAALDLILSGRTLDGAGARRIGLVDRVVPDAYLEAQAAELLIRVLAAEPDARRPDGGRHDWRAIAEIRTRTSLGGRLAEATPPGRALIATLARRRLAARVNEHNYPAPYFALRSTIEGRSLGLARGLDNEARLAGELAATSTCKNLIFLFRATTAAKSDPGVTGAVPPPRDLRKAGVIGAGRMGAGIAAACAAAGCLVRLRDVSWETVGGGIGAAARIVEAERGRGRIDAREAAARHAAISGTVDWSGFRAADLVLEAAVEKLEVKREVFAKLEDLVGDGAILASNTSAIPIADLAAGARRPERFIGLHFFSPVERMPLVEVIVHRRTDRAVLASAVAWAKKLGKTPIVVKDGPGFLVNRLLMPYLGEALSAFEEGTAVEEADRQIRGFGMPVGPFELLDRIGLDVAGHVAGVLQGAFGERFAAPGVLAKLTETGRTGARGGLGFYRYGKDGKKQGADREARRIAGARRRRAAPEVPGRPAGRLTPIQERLLLPMINEAAAALGEGIVRSPADVDLGTVLGAGFPTFRGGLLRFADTLGAANIVERLEVLAGTFGPRFAPAGHLKDLGRESRGFHQSQ